MEYIDIFTIQNVYVLRNVAVQATNARKTPTAHSVSGPVSNHFCIRGPCYRLRLLQAVFIQIPNEYSEF